MAATLTSAVAQKDARVVNTRNGERLVCDFRTVNGEDITLWKPTTDTALAAIKRNQSVKLIKDSKGWNLLVEESSAPTPAPVAAPQVAADTLSPEAKKAIAQYASELTKLYSFCLQQAQKELEGQDMETLRRAADRVFDACTTRFDLA